MHKYAHHNAPIILAYSGGLDTSFLIPYLKERERRPIICATINTGSLDGQEELLKARAVALGADDFVMVHATDTYVNSILSYLIKGNVRKNRTYPLCVGAERIVQAQELITIASRHKAYAIAHGCTGAGNDQIRFHIYFQVLAPHMKIIAPIRDEAMLREDEFDFLASRGFDTSVFTQHTSINDGLWGKTLGSRDLQDTSRDIPSTLFSKTKTAPSEELLHLEFKSGLPYAINGQAMSLTSLIQHLHELGSQYGIGRGIHVGNTALGIKGRIAFEAPAAAILLEAHQELEKLVLTKWQAFWKDQLSQFYADQLHEGQWFDPSMRAIEAFFDATQEHVCGTVTLRLSPERLSLVQLSSPHSLLANKEAIYGEETHLWSGGDAKGFAQIQAIQSQRYTQAKQARP